MNRLDKDYQMLLEYILSNGVEKEDRTGTGTLSIFGWQIRHKMSEGFPLLTTKKIHWKSVVTELLWFLRGDTNIKYLVDNGCNIWNGDAYKKFTKLFTREYHGPRYTLEQFTDLIKTNEAFARDFGDLGPIYGKQWRKWGKRNVTNYDLKDVKYSDQPKVLEAIKNGEDVTKYGVKIEYQNNSIDQIQNLINELKTNPDSRRLMVNAWNVGELDQMALPPCHYGFQVYTRKTTREEKIVNPGKYRAISLMWNQRSVDTFLGLPFNIASYALLLEIIAKEVDMIPDELIGNLGDVHLYSNHIEQAKEQITREPFQLPKLKYMDHLETFNSWLFDPRYGIVLRPKDFILNNYQSHPAIKAPLSN